MISNDILLLIFWFVVIGTLSFIAMHFLRAVAENAKPALLSAKWYREIILPHLPVLISVIIAIPIGYRGKDLYIAALGGYFSSNLYRALKSFGIDAKVAISKMIAERLK